MKVFNDLREPNDPETPVSVPGNVPFQPPPRGTKGNVVLDNGSFTPTATPDPPTAAPAVASAPSPAQASNVLMVSGARSANHHPLMVAGPQIGYYYPGFTLEMDLHGPGIN